MPGRPTTRASRLARGSLAPIAPRRDLREEVYQSLRRAVLEIASQSGEPVELRESEVARSLAVSRTPVREALTRLQQEGLVARAPRRKITVVPRTLDEYFSWLEIRELLEEWAARRAAGRATRGPIVDEMRSVFGDLAPDGSLDKPREYARTSAGFHVLIARASGNPVLERLIAQVCEQTEIFRFQVVERLRRSRQSHAEHMAIIDAIAAGDGPKAARLMREHLREFRRAAREGMQKAPRGRTRRR